MANKDFYLSMPSLGVTFNLVKQKITWWNLGWRWEGGVGSERGSETCVKYTKVTNITQEWKESMWNRDPKYTSNGSANTISSFKYK